MLWQSSTVVLGRRINHPLDQVERALCDPTLTSRDRQWHLALGPSTFWLERPFGVVFPPFGVEAASWTAPASLKGGRRPPVPVEVEINDWEPGVATQLLVRPKARHPERWSGRRLRVYFEMAHDAADTLLRALHDHCTAQHAQQRPHVTVSAHR